MILGVPAAEMKPALHCPYNEQGGFDRIEQVSNSIAPIIEVLHGYQLQDACVKR
jgi:hypothetical protein